MMSFEPNLTRPYFHELSHLNKDYPDFPKIIEEIEYEDPHFNFDANIEAWWQDLVVPSGLTSWKSIWNLGKKSGKDTSKKAGVFAKYLVVHAGHEAQEFGSGKDIINALTSVDDNAIKQIVRDRSGVEPSSFSPDQMKQAVKAIKQQLSADKGISKHNNFFIADQSSDKWKEELKNRGLFDPAQLGVALTKTTELISATTSKISKIEKDINTATDPRELDELNGQKLGLENQLAILRTENQSLRDQIQYFQNNPIIQTVIVPSDVEKNVKHTYIKDSYDQSKMTDLEVKLTANLILNNKKGDIVAGVLGFDRPKADLNEYYKKAMVSGYKFNLNNMLLTPFPQLQLEINQHYNSYLDNMGASNEQKVKKDNVMKDLLKEGFAERSSAISVGDNSKIEEIAKDIMRQEMATGDLTQKIRTDKSGKPIINKKTGEPETEGIYSNVITYGQVVDEMTELESKSGKKALNPADIDKEAKRRIEAEGLTGFGAGIAMKRIKKDIMEEMASVNLGSLGDEERKRLEYLKGLKAKAEEKYWKPSLAQAQKDFAQSKISERRIQAASSIRPASTTDKKRIPLSVRSTTAQKDEDDRKLQEDEFQRKKEERKKEAEEKARQRAEKEQKVKLEKEKFKTEVEKKQSEVEDFSKLEKAVRTIETLRSKLKLQRSIREASIKAKELTKDSVITDIVEDINTLPKTEDLNMANLVEEDPYQINPQSSEEQERDKAKDLVERYEDKIDNKEVQKIYQYIENLESADKLNDFIREFKRYYKKEIQNDGYEVTLDGYLKSSGVGYRKSQKIRKNNENFTDKLDDLNTRGHAVKNLTSNIEKLLTAYQNDPSVTTKIINAINELHNERINKQYKGDKITIKTIKNMAGIKK